MTDSHEKMTFFNDASWKVDLSPKVGVLIALNSNPLRFSKLVARVLSYVPGKCTTVIVVNWAEIGHSMKYRKLRVQSSLFRSICLMPAGRSRTALLPYYSPPPPPHPNIAEVARLANFPLPRQWLYDGAWRRRQDYCPHRRMLPAPPKWKVEVVIFQSGATIVELIKSLEE
jgi:hypothetical protein